MTELDADGNFLVGLDLEHHVLARSPFEEEVFCTCKPMADFGYLCDTASVSINQGGEETEPDILDAMAIGQLAFGELLYPHLRPTFGYIDDQGDNRPQGNNLKNAQLKYVLWANFYSPAYVAKHGRKFLLGAPGWKNQELDDGGILYVVTESYFEWWTSPPKDAISYFQTKLPTIKAYRSKKGNW
jgi:hypothetical protein